MSGVAAAWICCATSGGEGVSSSLIMSIDPLTNNDGCCCGAEMMLPRLGSMRACSVHSWDLYSGMVVLHRPTDFLRITN